MLHKRGDKFDTANWRPISLLCCDYKILAKVLTMRLTQVISSVTSITQTCGTPGRFSGESVRLLQDIVNYADEADIGGSSLLSLDQEKAFDRVEWSFMLAILQRMNFGPMFQQWISLLYTNIFPGSKSMVSLVSSSR